VSANASAATFAPGVPVAYVAVGTKFPDALTAGPAAAQQGGPVLLTTTDALPASVAAELARLAPQRIVVVGGPASVSDAVLAALDAYTAGPVSRIGGPDRYAVAAGISAATFAPGVPVAYVAVGTKFPDALTAGPAAAHGGGPVLLTGTDSLPASIAAELTRLAPQRIVVAGGPASVSDAVLVALDAYTSGPVSRIGGPDRYAVAAGISSTTFAGADTVYLANGANFPDALSGGPAAGFTDHPMLLTSTGSLPASIAAEISRLQPTRVIVLGGPASVSEAVIAQLQALLP
jgi:putative cell wall-binding protein